MTEALAAGLRAFVEELVRAGLREAVICPGSRSTPMALALAAHDRLAIHVLLDERSAAFAALGMAKVARRPVAVLVTSGTAAVELAPAVAEADLARVPLLLLTADRPPELRDRGAAQTIAQSGLFGSHVRWWTEVPLMDGDLQTIAQWRWTAGRAMAEAAGTGRGAGPVHLDLPYRDPLVPAGRLGPEPDLSGSPFLHVVGGSMRADLAGLAARMATVGRGLVVAGPDADASVGPALAELSRVSGYPILADGLSPARGLGGVLAGDHLVRPGRWLDAHRPELILRLGAIPTSRATNELLAHPAHELWVLDGDAGWRQPAPRPSTIVHADPAWACLAVADLLAAGTSPSDTWRCAWTQAQATVDAALQGWLTGLDEPFEGQPFTMLDGVLPGGTLLWVGSSMPVRDLDGWFRGPARARAVANRGTNGIDGVTSAAAGAAAVHDGPVVLVTGDISFVHDLGALVTARLLGVSLTILVIDNDGGGIFSFLAQSTTDQPEVGLPERFERLFGTPHGTPIGAVAAALGARVQDVDHRSLEPALRDAIADRTPGVRVLRFATDRRRNVELHSQAARVAADVLERLA